MGDSQGETLRPLHNILEKLLVVHWSAPKLNILPAWLLHDFARLEGLQHLEVLDLCLKIINKLQVLVI